MSDVTTTEVTETVTEENTETETQQLPDDHPLVKTLAAQKAQIRELKAKASRLDEIEEASKSEAEKVADRLAKADAEVAGIPAKVSEALKAHLIAIHSFDQEDAELFLTATDPELLLKQAERLVGQSGKRKNIVSREGRIPNQAQTDPTRDFLRSINGQG